MSISKLGPQSFSQSRKSGQNLLKGTSKSILMQLLKRTSPLRLLYAEIPMEISSRFSLKFVPPAVQFMGRH
jgi:hypothetical protein